MSFASDGLLALALAAGGTSAQDVDTQLEAALSSDLVASSEAANRWISWQNSARPG